VHATVDLSTYRTIPWEEGTAGVPARLRRTGLAPGRAAEGGAEGAAMGFTVKCASEYEFFLFKENAGVAALEGVPEPDAALAGDVGYSWLRASENAPLVHDLLDKLAAFDIEVKGFTPNRPRVYEAAIRTTRCCGLRTKAACSRRR